MDAFRWQRGNSRIGLQDREASVDRHCAGGDSKGKAGLYGQRGDAHQHWAVEESTHDTRQLVRCEDGGVGVEGQRGGLLFTACAADQGTREHAAMTFREDEFEAIRGATQRGVHGMPPGIGSVTNQPGIDART